MLVFGNIHGLSYYSSKGEAGSYVTMSNPHEEDADQEREELEELEIHPSDNLLVSAKWQTMSRSEKYMSMKTVALGEITMKTNMRKTFTSTTTRSCLPCRSVGLWVSDLVTRK